MYIYIFSPPASQHNLTSTKWLGFQPPNTSSHSPQMSPSPSFGSAPPLQLLPRLFSSVVSLIFSLSCSSFPTSSSSSCAVWACLGVSLTLENLSECSADAVSWWSEGETEEGGGGKGVRRRRCSGCGDTTPYFIRAEPDECVYLLIVLYRRKVWLLRTKVAESQYAFLPQLFVIFSISLPLKVREMHLYLELRHLHFQRFIFLCLFMTYNLSSLM